MDTKNLSVHMYNIIGLTKHFLVSMESIGTSICETDQQPQQFQKRGPSEALDFEGSYSIIGCLTYNSQTYAVLDAPHDRSCFYHLFSSMI